MRNNPTPHPFLARTATLAALLGTVWSTRASAQAPVEFVPLHPIIHVSVRDLPGFIDACAGTAAARLIAVPDVAEVVAEACARNHQFGARWDALAARIFALAPESLSVLEHGEIAARRLGLSQLSALQFGFAMSPPKANPEPEDAFAWMQPHTYRALRPIPAALDQARTQFATLLDQLRATPPLGLRLAEQQTILGGAGLGLAPAPETRPAHYEYLMGEGRPAWALDHDGLLIGGVGADNDWARLGEVSSAGPEIEIVVEPMRFARLLSALAFGWYYFPLEGGDQSLLALLGLTDVSTVSWHVRVAGDQLQEDVSLPLPQQPKGILAAILQSVAPLPDQPLPDGTLLQARLGLDVQMLTKALDEWLVREDQPTLHELKIADDLQRAWTGGIALAILRPATGGLMPRLYASFGIADDAALQRLLTKVQETWPVETMQREYEGVACTQCTFEGGPPGLQPTFGIVDDTLHVAESPLGLRALLRARRDGAPRALDVGAAKRPQGKGRLLPGIDVRYDARAIHAALHDVWLPLGAQAIVQRSDEVAPLVALRDMPDIETIAPHLSRGRTVFRVDDQRLVGRSEGTFGGATGQALATAFGPLLSHRVAQEWYWAIENQRARLACLQQQRVYAAIKTFATRHGNRPQTLGELVVAGDLPDVTLLVLEGDTTAEPVMHDGKQVATSSFRYYPKGLAIKPEDAEVQALLITCAKSQWWRSACATDGTIHMGWGEFASLSIDQLEK